MAIHSNQNYGSGQCIYSNLSFELEPDCIWRARRGAVGKKEILLNEIYQSLLLFTLKEDWWMISKEKLNFQMDTEKWKVKSILSTETFSE